MRKERLRAAIDRSGMKQTRIAELLEVNVNTVSRWLSGDFNPTDEKKLRLAEILNTTVAYLMGETDHPNIGNSLIIGEIPKPEPSEKAKREIEIMKRALGSGYKHEGPTLLGAAWDKIEKEEKMQSNVHLAIDDEPESMEDQILIPVLSPEQTACCGNGIPCADMTYNSSEKVHIAKKDIGMFCEGQMPFAITADGFSMEKWGIIDGCRVIINPVEEVHDFDIALICYRDNLVLKKIRRLSNGGIELIASDGTTITVPADETDVPALFAIWGKAMAYTYRKAGKIKHGL